MAESSPFCPSPPANLQRYEMVAGVRTVPDEARKVVTRFGFATPSVAESVVWPVKNPRGDWVRYADIGQYLWHMEQERYLAGYQTAMKESKETYRAWKKRYRKRHKL